MMKRGYSSTSLSRGMRFVCVMVGACLLLASCTLAVDRSRFKTCDQDGFCRRNRNRFTAENPAPKHLGAFTTTEFTSSSDHLSMTAALEETVPAIFTEKGVAYPSRKMGVTVRAYEGGIFRVTVDEISREDGLSPRYSPEDVVVEKSLKQLPVKMSKDKKTGRQVFVAEGDKSERKLVLPAKGEAFNFELLTRDPKTQDYYTTISAKNLLFENHMKKPEPAPDNVAEGPMPENAKEDLPKPTKSPAADIDIDGAWEESFDKKKDSKPNGPGAVGIDLVFEGADAVYGIPEHASSMALKDTKTEYHEPYRLFNADVFEYELDETMALYGAVPVVVAHDSSRGTTTGMLWLNPSETWVDVHKEKDAKKEEIRWTSEDGVADVWLFSGPSAGDVFNQYTSVTGRPFLPPLFSTAYHQCRWNYNSQDDVHEVDENFDKYNIPYDVIWLDIEHTDGKRYFTWDSSKFSQPEVMLKNLSDKGRKLVTIVDPHIKRDNSYYVHKEASEKSLYVLRPDGTTDYEGHCWPGSSSWIDFMNPEARTFWASKFGLDQYRGSSENLFIWNDMNEPAIFSGCETTMERDCIHHGKLEHRQIHNMFGYVQVMATNEGLCRRVENQRPFILTRSFFAGTQKLAAVWTGDNQAKWPYLQSMIPMVLSLNLAGIVFSGADVAGFFGNPSEELLVRWYQAGALVPFFRAHAHLETRRREPWLFEKETTDLIRDAVLLRYRLMPYIYTAFHESSVSGAPIARALWTEYPTDSRVVTVDSEYMFGPSLLVNPVTIEGAKEVSVLLPEGIFYDFDTLQPVTGPNDDYRMDVTLSKIPIFYRGGSVVPTRQRPRRSTTQQINDPYTLYVAPDVDGSANGSLYIDDGKSFDYQKKGAFDMIHYHLERDGKGAMTLTGETKTRAYETKVGIERIVIMGVSVAPKSVSFSAGKQTVPVSFTYNESTKVLTLKKPVPSVLDNWRITIA